MKIAFFTLGCKVNQYETQALEAAAAAAGHIPVSFDGEADAYVINSCTVTAVSDRKSRAAVRQARRRCPGAVVAVCGCWAQVSPEAAAEVGADLVTGTAERGEFISRLERAVTERAAAFYLDDPFTRRGFERLSIEEAQLGTEDFPGSDTPRDNSAPLGEATPAYSPEDGVTSMQFRQGAASPIEVPPSRTARRTRAMLKIEDGCVNFCTYCIIPYARGPVRSLPPDEAAAQAVRLAEKGYRELVLTGIEISSYGAEFKDGTGLIDLVERLAAAVPDVRLRLGSLEPRTITEDFCRRAAALKHLCPQFHLSLQSGCDETLRRMGRRYDTDRFRDSVRLLRQWFDDPGITTDLIVGFPGESEEEFARTLSFLSECGFSAVHIFPYSPRPGTPAADLPGQIPSAEKQARARRASAVAAEGEGACLARQVGRVLPVLFETLEDGYWRGFAANYIEVRVPDNGDLRNQIRSVRITAAAEHYVTGEMTLD